MKQLLIIALLLVCTVAKSASFDNYFPILIEHEGNDKFVSYIWDNDGGGTKYGITLKLLKSLAKKGWQLDKDGNGIITAKDLHLLTIGEAKAIYKMLFWDFFSLDYCQYEITAQIICDQSVMSGATAIMGYRYQNTLGTNLRIFNRVALIKRINYLPQKTSVKKLSKFRWYYLQHCKAFPHAKKGWRKRVNSFIYHFNKQFNNQSHEKINYI